MKILCVLLPHFPLRCEILKKPQLAGQPAILMQVEGSQKLVLDYSSGLDNLERGMPLQQALARQGAASLIQADIPYYCSVFTEILERLETRCPLVEGYDLGQAYLGLDGMQLIYPDDQSLVKSLQAVLPEVFKPQMGIAGGKFPSYLAALDSAAGNFRTLTGEIRDYLKNLPCEVLPVSLKSKEKLHNFGIKTLGQVAAMPSGPLQAQFGPEGKTISELASGFDSTQLYPRFMEENIEESTVLSSVTVALEAILITVEALLTRVFARDILKGRGIRRLNLWTRGWRTEHWEHTVQYKEPAMDVKNVMARIKPLLEGFPQPGPVERIGLQITGMGYRSGRQKSLFSEVRAMDRLMDDIKQLEFRMGGPQIFRIKEVEPWSRIPERRYVLAPISQ
jgi:DNA polymerase-4/protein ImuB